jgi:transposase InsO family protein
VVRLMRVVGLQGCVRARKRRTTRHDPRAAPAPDVLRRDFVAAQPNKVWLADITYIQTREGFLYEAFILDTHSRKVVGWSMDTHMRTKLVVDALEMALWRRKPGAGLIHHTDRGSQYTALSFGRRLQEAGLEGLHPQAFRGQIPQRNPDSQRDLRARLPRRIQERLAQHPVGELLASASVDETVGLWDIEVESLIADACSTANRNLSNDEWIRFVGPEFDYARTCSSLPAGYGAT